jgi:hypothetical protein
MDFRIPEPCPERWDEMQPRGEGRYCDRCQHTVLDLSRMSRRQAEHRLKAERGDYVCVRLAFDPLERPVFRPEPSRAPYFAGGLVLVAALTAGGCAGTETGAGEPEVAQLAPDPAAEPPMMPVADGPMLPTLTEAPGVTSDTPELATGPVDAEVVDDDPTPTAAQRALTRRKHARDRPDTPVYHLAGRMPLPPR